MKQIEAMGVRSMAVTGNIGDRDAVQKMREEIEGKFGAVEILVNCAGGDIGASGNKPEPNNILGITYEDLITLTNNNLIGTMLMTQAFVPQMVKRQHGVVVNIASVAAHVGVSNGGIYATLKAALCTTRAVSRRKCRRTACASTAVSPGPSKTARFQATRTVDPDKMNSNKVSMDRYAEPEEIADAVALLCTPEAKFMHGQASAWTVASACTPADQPSSASISARVGIDGAVPGFCTENAAVAQPNRTASIGDCPSASATANPPPNASPAPVVSTTFVTLNDGTRCVPSAPCSSAPFSPSVISAFFAPRRTSSSAAASASSSLVTGRPVSVAASVSFGVT